MEKKERKKTKEVRELEQPVRDLTKKELIEIITIRIMDGYDNCHHDTNVHVRMNLRELIKTILNQNL